MKELELDIESFRKAINLIGSQKKVANVCGFCQQAASKFALGKLRHFKPEYAVKIQRAAGNKIKCNELMPNYDWSIFFGEST